VTHTCAYCLSDFTGVSGSRNVFCTPRCVRLAEQERRDMSEDSAPGLYAHIDGGKMKIVHGLAEDESDGVTP